MPSIWHHLQLGLFTRNKDSETSYMVLPENHCTVWDFTQHRVRYKAVVSQVALPIRPIAPQTRHSPSFAPSIVVSITISDQKESVDLCKSDGTYVPHWYSTVQLFWLPPGKSQIIVLPFTIEPLLHGKTGTLQQWDIFKYLPLSWKHHFHFLGFCFKLSS